MKQHLTAPIFPEAVEGSPHLPSRTISSCDSPFRSAQHANPQQNIVKQTSTTHHQSAIRVKRCERELERRTRYEIPHSPCRAPAHGTCISKCSSASSTLEHVTTATLHSFVTGSALVWPVKGAAHFFLSVGAGVCLRNPIALGS